MIQAKLDGRKRRGAMTRKIAYQRVLLAVYMLADGEWSDVFATNAEICRDSGCSLAGVRRSLAEMERRGLISVFLIGCAADHPSGRVMVLMDHPRAASTCGTWRAYLDQRTDPAYVELRSMSPKWEKSNAAS
jgi:hypothetical protein